MKAREFPGALALGLPVALLAHVAAFGTEHSLGGAYHQALSVTAALISIGVVLALMAMACSSAQATQTGSVLAARLFALLPGTAPLSAAAVGWFCLIESVEPQHRPAPLLTGAALVLAALLIGMIARGLTTLLAEITISILSLDFSPRVPVFATQPIGRAPHALSPAVRRRLYSRPPPRIA
ncbi:MAG: hypothetical protein M3Y21_09335 [Candidatus Eremiobacteraeota bacterium]|nr:hypothetical protein [Candidatus Eremiobacteraeota bacterium]